MLVELMAGVKGVAGAGTKTKLVVVMTVPLVRRTTMPAARDENMLAGGL